MRATSFTRTGVALALTVAALTRAEAQKVSPPPAGALRPYVFPQVEQFTLANGLKVVLVEKHTLPVVQGRLIIDAGACPAALTTVIDLSVDPPAIVRVGAGPLARLGLEA